MSDSWSPDEEEMLKKAFEEVENLWRRSTTSFYKLDENKNPVSCSVDEFEMQHKNFEKYKRVAKTILGPYTISTVFLSIDHNFSGEGKPILFETMIWSDKMEDKPGQFFGFQERYCTWAEAVEGHRRIVSAVEVGTLP